MQLFSQVRPLILHFCLFFVGFAATNSLVASGPVCKGVIRTAGVWQARVIELPGRLHDAHLLMDDAQGTTEIHVEYGDSPFESNHRDLVFNPDSDQMELIDSDLTTTPPQIYHSPLKTLLAIWDVETRMLSVHERRTGETLFTRSLASFVSDKEAVGFRSPFRPRFSFSLDDRKLMLVTPHRAQTFDVNTSLPERSVTADRSIIVGADFLGLAPVIYAPDSLFVPLDHKGNFPKGLDDLQTSMQGAIGAAAFYADGRDYLITAQSRQGESYLHLFRFDYSGIKHARVRNAHHVTGMPFTWMKSTPLGVLTYSEQSRLLIHHNPQDLDPEGP